MNPETKDLIATLRTAHLWTSKDKDSIYGRAADKLTELVQLIEYGCDTDAYRRMREQRDTARRNLHVAETAVVRLHEEARLLRADVKVLRTISGFKEIIPDSQPG